MLGAIYFLAAGTVCSGQEALTLRQAIDEALRQNPQTAVAESENHFAKAASVSARSALLPKLQFVEDISRGNDPVYVFGTRLRQQQFTANNFALNELNTPQPVGNFSTRFSGTWTAFDWLKTQHEIRRADLMEKSSVSASQQVQDQIILSVVQAYQSVLYAQRKLDVATHQQQTAQSLLESVADRVNAGLAVESDRMLSQVNLAARQQDVIAAKGELQIAWLELQTAMGSEKDLPVELQPIEFHLYPQKTLAEELAAAMKSRPELKAQLLADAAQTAALQAARADFAPSISTYGNWEQDRTSFTGTGGNNWVAGVQLRLDLLPMAKRAVLAQQKADMQRMNALSNVLQQQVRLEVSRAHVQRQTAELTVQTAKASMEQSSEALRILRNRYNAGLASINDLLQAEDAQRQSQASYWQAVYGNAVAYAQQLYSMGTLTPEAAEVLQ